MEKNIICKKIGYIVATIILSVLIMGALSINAYSQSLENKREYEKVQIDQMEKNYIKAMKATMEDYGCAYAGITMTKIYGEDVNEYEVFIHHSNLSYMDKATRNELEKMLNHVVNDFPNASFYFEFSY